MRPDLPSIFHAAHDVRRGVWRRDRVVLCVLVRGVVAADFKLPDAPMKCRGACACMYSHYHFSEMSSANHLRFSSCTTAAGGEALAAAVTAAKHLLIQRFTVKPAARIITAV